MELVKTVREEAKGRGWNIDADNLAQVELVLTVLRRVAPQEPASSGWALLRGYRHVQSDDNLLRVAGWLVGELKSEPVWQARLGEYLQIPEQIRGFVLDGLHGVAQPRHPASDADRHDHYRRALLALPEHRIFHMPVAESEQNYVVTSAGVPETVTMPPVLPTFSRAAGYGPLSSAGRRPVSLTREELDDFAVTLDEEDKTAGRESQNWSGRVKDLGISFRQADGSFARAEVIDLGRLHHLAGMVGAGKSTLMDLLAIWCARKGHRITVVIADVSSVLARVELYRRYGVSAAPVLGASSRGRHIQQLHRPGVRPVTGVAAMNNPMLKWTSSACALSSQRSKPEAWPLDDAPCFTLTQVETGPRGGTREIKHQCPLWHGCQRHRASKELVDARIWVATPAGLVYTRTPSALAEQEVRYLEMAWFLSDLIIIDEADQVQTQFDGIFSPSQTLAGSGNDAWLRAIDVAKNNVLNDDGFGQLRDGKVWRWSTRVDRADMLKTWIYGMLSNHPHLRAWVNDGYFNEWTLGVRLAAALARRPLPKDQITEDGPTHLIDEDLAASWRTSFAKWSLGPTDTDKPTRDPRADFLRDFCQRMLSTDDGDVVRKLRKWLRERTDIVQPDTKEHLEQLVLRLQFLLLVGMLATEIGSITGGWGDVEAPLRMRGHSTSLVHRPPVEYVSLVPDSPMGNLIGFQYQHDDTETDRMGVLRFFRCNGIGRWLLLDLPNLYSDQGNTSPGVLLMSATSWAGTSPRYDLQVQVTCLLEAPAKELAGVQESTFLYSPQSYGDTDTKIKVSGQRAERRAAALAAMVHQLARVRNDGLGVLPSRLEQQRAELPANRQRIMLLVGSYDECDIVLRELLRARPDWAGQIVRLVPDDATYTQQWTGHTLARGSVAELQHTDAWIMIAPLLAVERGHNILNSDRVAALGAAYFLIRPHPRPDDIAYHVQAINRWAVEQIRNGLPAAGSDSEGLQERARAFIIAAAERWRESLAHPLMVSALEDDELAAFMWTQLVTIWQVIGRLVRGGQSATVHFCDAAFDPTKSTSLLVGMHRVLTDAMAGIGIASDDADLARILYSPMHTALTKLLEPYRAL